MHQHNGIIQGMPDPQITTKELLLQLMKDNKELAQKVSDMNVLLQRHIEASENRDSHIARIELRLDGIEAKQDTQDAFRTRVLTIWGGVWSVFTLFAVYIVNRFF